MILMMVACSSNNGRCVDGLSPACQPLYDPPTYQTLFDKVFHPTCAAGSGTCHTADAAMKGLVFEDADVAYMLLTAPAGATPRVVPGDPACSVLVERLESPDATFRMPPGPTPLLAGARCAIEQWIAAGAQR